MNSKKIAIAFWIVVLIINAILYVKHKNIVNIIIIIITILDIIVLLFRLNKSERK